MCSFEDIINKGDWSNGMTWVSKTFSGGSIPSSPVQKPHRMEVRLYVVYNSAHKSAHELSSGKIGIYLKEL